MIAAMELFLRLFFPQNLTASEFDPYLRWKHIPNFNGKFCSFVKGEFCTDYKINSKSLRDFEYNYSRNKKYRILVLGDSFTVGHGVEMEESYPKLLEKMIGRGNVEIINAGHKGTGPDNYYLGYKHEFYKYDPDMVIVGLSLSNDIDYQSLVEFNQTKNGYSLYEKTPIKDGNSIIRFRRWLGQHSHLYNFLIVSFMKNAFINNFLIKAHLFAVPWRPPFGEESYEYNLQLNKTLLLVNYLNDYLLGQNKKIMFVLIPYDSQVYPPVYKEDVMRYNITRPLDMYLPNKKIKELCREKNMACLDLTGDFIKNSNLPLFFKYDRHWNRKGHEIASKLIYEKLINITSVP